MEGLYTKTYKALRKVKRDVKKWRIPCAELAEQH